VTDISKSFPPLNFNSYPLKLFKKDGQFFVKDEIRKKNLVLTPEEWVRQHCVHFLNQELNYPFPSIGLEGKLVINEQMKRFDILVYNHGEPLILVECKASSIKINQTVFDQIARYNLKLNVPYIWVTNGLNHFFATIDYKAQQYNFIKKLPQYKSVKP
jgi:hypothetical protein